MSKRKITIGVVVIVLVGGTVWGYLRYRPDPQVEKVKQMQAEAFKEGMTPEQRRESFQLVRQEMDKLSPAQRDQVREQMREGFERRMDQQMATYFALPPDKKVAYLDNQIKEQEQRRKEWEARRAQGGQAGRTQGGAGGQQAGSGPPGGAGGQQANGGQSRPPRDQSPDARLQRRDQRLDRSTAQQRAQRSAYFADLQQRRAQLGLPPMSGPGGRGPGGPGGPGPGR